MVRAAVSAIGPIDILIAHARDADQGLLELTADELDLSSLPTPKPRCC